MMMQLQVSISSLLRSRNVAVVVNIRNYYFANEFSQHSHFLFQPKTAYNILISEPMLIPKT